MTLRHTPIPVTVPGLSADQNALLTAFDDFFSGGRVTTAVGTQLREITQQWVFKDDDDDDEVEEDEEDAERKNAHEEQNCANYALFMQWANFIDSIVTDFVGDHLSSKPAASGAEKAAAAAAAAAGATKAEEEKQDGPAEALLQEVAELCFSLVDSPHAASFISIPYVASALDYEQFVDLVYDTRCMIAHPVGGSAEEGDAADEKE
jgi:hypothetical protein